MHGWAYKLPGQILCPASRGTAVSTPRGFTSPFMFFWIIGTRKKVDRWSSDICLPCSGIRISLAGLLRTLGGRARDSFLLYSWQLSSIIAVCAPVVRGYGKLGVKAPSCHGVKEPIRQFRPGLPDPRAQALLPVPV